MPAVFTLIASTMILHGFSLAPVRAAAEAHARRQADAGHHRRDALDGDARRDAAQGRHPRAAHRHLRRRARRRALQGHPDPAGGAALGRRHGEHAASTASTTSSRRRRTTSTTASSARSWPRNSAAGRSTSWRQSGEPLDERAGARQGVARAGRGRAAGELRGPGGLPPRDRQRVLPREARDGRGRRRRRDGACSSCARAATSSSSRPRCRRSSSSRATASCGS